MNTERIRRLAEQAGDDWDHTVEPDKEFLKKFAELIVRECIGQITGEWRPVLEAKERINIPHWEGYTQCGVDSVIAIREHFGIENEY